MPSSWLSHILWWEWNGYSHLEKAWPVFYEVKYLPDDFAVSYLDISLLEIKSFCLYKFLNTNSIYIFIYQKQLTIKWRKERCMHINERNKLITHKALMNHKCIILRERSQTLNDFKCIIHLYNILGRGKTRSTELKSVIARLGEKVLVYKKESLF